MLKFCFIAVALLILCCSSPNESQSKYNPPSDHTISKAGAMHKSGLTSPNDNCIECHGSDLRGGSTGVSCYECHGKMWP